MWDCLALLSNIFNKEACVSFCIGTTAILIKSFEFLVLVDVVFSAFFFVFFAVSFLKITPAFYHMTFLVFTLIID